MNKNKIRLVECFSGQGMQRRGIEASGLYDVENVATCEIDTWATIAYAATHEGLTLDLVDNYSDYPSKQEMIKYLTALNIGYDPLKDKQYDWQKKINSKDKLIEKTWLACKLSKNVGDISKVKQLPECDLLTYSFPCQSISIAGRLAGFEEDSGTRSSLVHEVMRLLVGYKKRNALPKYLLMENVRNLVSKRFLDDFNNIISLLDDIGYNTYWRVIDAKYCGVPQHRDRVFALSVRKDIDNGRFEFPLPFDNGVRLKHILDPHVDEKYYINTVKSQQMIDDLILNGKLTDDDVNDLKCLGNLSPVDNDKIHQRNWVYDEKGIINTQTATQYKDPSRVLQRNNYGG